jgi:hypothetical protein
MANMRCHVHHAGVVHQRSQGAQLGVHPVEHRAHRGFIRHVSLNGQGSATQGSNLVCHALGRGQVAHRIHGHIPSLGGGLTRHGRANAAPATGDQQGLVHWSILGAEPPDPNTRRTRARGV